jgi:hypothetical protein
MASRLWRWMRSTGAGRPWPEGAETCPLCHRPIAGAMAPGGPMGGSVPRRWPLSTPSELVALCPMDGPIGRKHQPRAQPIAELEREVRTVEARLSTDGEHSWARMLGKALDRQAETERLSQVGHALAILLRHGPLGRLSVGVSVDEVEQLLVDTVARWPPRGA